MPVLAACAVRTVTASAPTYGNPGAVDTPMGVMPLHLVLQIVRGPDVGLPAVLLIATLPTFGALLVIAIVIAFYVLR